MSLCSQGGWVICEEDRDTLLAAWEEDVIEQRKKDAAVSAVSSSYFANVYLVLDAVMNGL